MARPAKEKSEIIVANCDGKVLVWCDGALSGDEDMRREAEKATRLGDFMEIGTGIHVYADHKAVAFPEHVVAALIAYNPGRTLIQEISEENKKRLQDLKEEDTYVQNI